MSEVKKLRALLAEAREEIALWGIGPRSPIVQRIDAAFALRARVVPDATDAYRLLHGEGDLLPGVVCDRYGRAAVLKLDGEAACAWRAELIDALRAPDRKSTRLNSSHRT